MNDDLRGTNDDFCVALDQCDLKWQRRNRNSYPQRQTARKSSFTLFTFVVPPFRVRYADTDQMGYVYYGNYARFYEIGRVEALRSLGFSYKELEASGVLMPVYENTSRYLKPARYDDLLTETVMIPELPRARIVFQYAIRNEAGELLHTGQTTLVFQRADTGRLCAAPSGLLDHLKPFFDQEVAKA